MHVWVKSVRLGTVKLGLANSANEGITEIALASVLGQSNQEATSVSGVAAAVSPDF